jgi:O-antigen/teichoic acid export membrane protein
MRLRLHPLIVRMRRWGPALTKFLFVQIMVQALGALAGIIVVRTLDRQDYALYTISNSTTSGLFWLANSGITYAVSGIGGRVWQDRDRLGQVLKTALKVSRGMLFLASIPMLLLLVWLLHSNGGSVPAIAVILLIVMLGAFTQLLSGIYVLAPRLVGEFRFLQKIDFVAAASRLVLIAAASAIFLDTPVAMVIALAVAFAQWRAIRRWCSRNVNLAAPPDAVIASEMRTVARRQWPNELYFAFQGQISVFLLSLFGTTESVANLGALSRIGLLFAATTATMQGIVLPGFARCQDAGRLPRLYAQVLAGNIAFASLPVIAAIVAPGPFLWLLGPKYSQLSLALLLIAINAAAGTLNGVTGALNAARAWVIPGWFLVPARLATQLGLMAAIGVSTLPQVLWISILAEASSAALNIVAAAVFMRRFSRGRRAAISI